MCMASREWIKSRHQPQDPQVSGTIGDYGDEQMTAELNPCAKRIETNINKPFQANEERKKKQEDSGDRDCGRR